MSIDPLPEDIRVYLKAHFSDVEDEAPQGDYYVFSMKLPSGLLRRLKVHRAFFMFSGVVTQYLTENNLAEQLKRGDVEIVRPLPA